MRRLALCTAAVLGVVSPSLAGYVSFETVPLGSPSDGLSIGSQYAASQGMTFSLEGGGNPVLAMIGAPESAFTGVGNIGDNPAAGQGVGSFMLTDDGFLNPTMAAPLIVSYSAAVAKAGGVILDIDGGEAWLVEARDASDNVLSSLTLDGSSVNAGDGLATEWEFDGLVNDIFSVRFSYIGYYHPSRGLGLAFDNFWSEQTNTIDAIGTPEPASAGIAACLAGVFLAGRRRRAGQPDFSSP